MPPFITIELKKNTSQTICYIMYDISMNRQRGENVYSPFFSCPNFTSTSYSPWQLWRQFLRDRFPLLYTRRGTSIQSSFSSIQTII